MASQQPAEASEEGSAGPGQRRASRKGAVRRFACNHPGCDKKYSRTEHLQRHQLNHNPKEIFQCDVGDCTQRFVRIDLLVRHKKRHTPSYAPRNRVPSFDTPSDWNITTPEPSATNRLAGPLAGPQPQGRTRFSSQLPLKATPDVTGFLVPGASATAEQAFLRHRPRHSGGLGSSWACSADATGAPDPNAVVPRQDFYGCDAAAVMQEPSTLVALSNGPYAADDQLTQGNNFATWMLDPQATYADLGSAGLPFGEPSMGSVFLGSTLGTMPVDHESLDSIASTEQPSLHPDASRHSDSTGDLLDEARYGQVVHWFHEFHRRQSASAAHKRHGTTEAGVDLPPPSMAVMRQCLEEFWDKISPRLPMVHQHTFRANGCPVFLLLAMMALGAASFSCSKDTSARVELATFADVVVASIRWEILTCHESTPPIALWVAQALLLVEFYETFYSSRRLHERAHIYHPCLLTLLRRGSSLIGRSGREPLVEADAGGGQGNEADTAEADTGTWWERWIEAESMRRVVFSAFMLDIMHAAMFGHGSDMAAHEIRLSLPCEEQVWMSGNARVVRQVESGTGTCRLSFLDGVRNAFAGNDVRTHAWGRVIVMCGLLSVAWHLGHRETYLKWLDLWEAPKEAQVNWKKMVLRALDRCKESFDAANSGLAHGAMSSNASSHGVMSSALSHGATNNSLGHGALSNASSHGATSNGLTHGAMSNEVTHCAAVVYHLAHISLHVDIVDCQVYAGAKELMGRSMSSQERGAVAKRMSMWARQASTRGAILHAFRLVQSIIVSPCALHGRDGVDAYACCSRAAAVATQQYKHHDAPTQKQFHHDASTQHYEHHATAQKQTQYQPHASAQQQYPRHYYNSSALAGEGDAQRAWVVYYATLTIWAFVQAVGRPAGKGFPLQAGDCTYVRMSKYVAQTARLGELDEGAAAALYEGLPDLLEVVEGVLEAARGEVLDEARRRLAVCREMLLGGGGGVS